MSLSLFIDQAGEIVNNTPTYMLLTSSTEQLRLEIGLPGIFRYISWNQLKNTPISTGITDFLVLLGENDILLYDSLPYIHT